jgi:hypothetical protein
MIAVQASLGRKLSPYLKNNYSKKGWVWLKGGVPAWLTQSPEFKP